MIGEIDRAVEYYLNERLSKPMAMNVRRHKQVHQPFYGALYDDQRVRTRLAELDADYEQLREEIGELMLDPEWNQ